MLILLAGELDNMEVPLPRYQTYPASHHVVPLACVKHH